MSTFYLVIVDSVGIQPYIFASNRLRENSGASHLVHQATTGWLMANPNAFLMRPHNILNGKRVAAQAGIETGALEAELIYAGGGNTLLLFHKKEDAIAYRAKLSEWIITKAPGLHIVSIIKEFEWEQPLAAAVKQAFEALTERKMSQEPSLPVLGLSVTAAGRSTGLAANYVAREPGESNKWLPLSAEVQAKWDNNPPAKERLKNELGQAIPADYDFPDQFDDLGRSEGEQSYIAVVHADGNGMGKTLEGISLRYAHAGAVKNREYIEKLREFSDAANEAGLHALQTVVDRMVAWNKTDIVQPRTKDGKKFLSLRPLVYGGDDVTFVCDGRLGLKAAQVYLEAFERQRIPDENGELVPGGAAAGIAIVKVRYPFARAYQMAEALCGNAKDRFKREVSAMDWHRAQSGLFGSLSDIRRVEYEEQWADDPLCPERSLTMRPISITADPVDGWRTWHNFGMILKAFQSSEDWPRNKVIALREVLRAGDQAVARYTQTFGRNLPRIEYSGTEHQKRGWIGGRCVYFDAIEMIDQEIPS
ncbi:MAG: hypothetical protein GXP38_05075 [Chloroflexi bacterium]|nr:hypothetical protein [Chloroflexota bacterium]